MLALSRKRNEKIVADLGGGEWLEIAVLDFAGHGKGRRVVLGIQAPRRIKVHREEVWQSIRGVVSEEDSRHG